MSKIDMEKILPLVEQGYLTMRPHPTHDLVILNYTPRVQYERYWTPETLMCRGLIVKPDGTIVARPFPKFFNLEEYAGQIPLEDFEVTEKMDGSLGILYFADGKPYIATRGSFTSEQAEYATKLLYKRYADFIPMIQGWPYYTLLFEIIYPQNRIVIDYGAMEDIVLLAVIFTETGEDEDIYNLHWVNMWPFPLAKHYGGIKDIAQLKSLEETNKEGFVLRFESGLRLKAKFAEYVRLHKILTQCTARSIWEYLKDGKPLDELLERVPDEFYAWVKRTKEDLLTQFSVIETQCREVVERVKDLPTRKEQAMVVTKTKYSGIVFSMLDHKNYQDLIWKLLYPEATRPFKIDEEG